MSIKQITQLPASTTLASTDVLAKETSGNTTQKITAENAVASLKTIGNLLGTNDVINDLTTGGTTVPLSAEMGKTIAGKIIDSSSGTYVKFADGTLINYDIITNFTFNANTTTTKTYSFTQSFAYAPTVITGINTTIPDKLTLSTYGVTLSQYTLNGVSSFSANQTPTVFVIAIGRWK